MTTADEKRELAVRLNFMGLDEQSRKTLRGLGPVIDQSIDAALEAFYKKVRSTPQTAAFFKDESHLQSAKKRQSRHWSVVAAAKYDETFVEGVQAVGAAHARIGLEPRWYIGGYAVVIEQLIHSVIEKRWPSRFGKSRSKQLAEETGVLVKAALLDMDYSISIYLDILARERREAEDARKRGEREQAVALDALNKALDDLSHGDLQSALPSDLPANFAAMVTDYNAAVEKLRVTIGTVRNAAEEILKGTGAISEAAEDLAHRTEQQAAGLEESTAALHELTQNVGATADGAKKAAEAVGYALTEARSSGEVVTRAVVAMGEIEKSSDEISKIIGVIDEIAFQTNLLALNAGVEAARAGEAGRGFAVVAQEVRELAQRCASAAREIKNLISQSSGQVQNGVNLVNNAGSALEKIIGRIVEINRIVLEISGAAANQSVGLREVNAAIGSLDGITQRNAAMVEETSAQTEALKQEVEGLVTALRGFRMHEARGMPEMPARRRA